MTLIIVFYIYITIFFLLPIAFANWRNKVITYLLTYLLRHSRTNEPKFKISNMATFITVNCFIISHFLLGSLGTSVGVAWGPLLGSLGTPVGVAWDPQSIYRIQCCAMLTIGFTGLLNLCFQFVINDVTIPHSCSNYS